MIKLKHFPKMSEQYLRQKSEPVKTAKEAEEIKQRLMELFPDQGGYAICAIQVGIPKRATLIRFPSQNSDPKAEPVYTFMVNPVIADFEDQRIFKGEGCLSFPKKHKDTVRYNKVTVKYQEPILGELEDKGLMADGVDAVIVQHEVDHMEGIIFKDRRLKVEPVQSVKIGRNEPCPCGSGKKYKKCCL